MLENKNEVLATEIEGLIVQLEELYQDLLDPAPKACNAYLAAEKTGVTGAVSALRARINSMHVRQSPIPTPLIIGRLVTTFGKGESVDG